MTNSRNLPASTPLRADLQALIDYLESMLPTDHVVAYAARRKRDLHDKMAGAVLTRR